MVNLTGTYNQILSEYLGSKFEYLKPAIEDKYDIEIIKTLGESSGIAYLTSDNKVFKLTSSQPEIKVSLDLEDNPNPYFPEIFMVDIFKIGGSNWYSLLKEFIPKLPTKVENDFKQIEKTIYEWFEDSPNDPTELLDYYLNELATSNNLFLDYLKDDKPELVYIYKQLIEITKVGMKNNTTLDIHDENLGWRNNQIVLFDY